MLLLTVILWCCSGVVLYHYHADFIITLYWLLSEEDDEYSDDDDMSWKVRRASAKCLDAIMATRHELLAEFYQTVSPALIARFKGLWFWLGWFTPGVLHCEASSLQFYVFCCPEREENVKADIFHAYITLLKQTRPAVTADPDAMEQEERSGVGCEGARQNKKEANKQTNNPKNEPVL